MLYFFKFIYYIYLHKYFLNNFSLPSAPKLFGSHLNLEKERKRGRKPIDKKL